jgi:diguanylate cyclase (GGDEF)-like protein
LLTRDAFYRRIEGACLQAKSLPFSVIVLGLDRFRDINHILGPKSADKLLKQVARRFQRALAKPLVKAWLGSDEFGAIIPIVNEAKLKTSCGKLLSALDTPFVVDRVPVDLSASVGIALCPAHSKDADLLFQRANIALENTKQFGRGYSIFDPANDPYTQLKLAYVSGLRHAIEQDQIVLHYQPKISMNTGRAIGVEALVQWHHPRQGLMPANQFVPVAERTGLIHALSRWVLRMAIAQCSEWKRTGLTIPVAVNLSPRNFHDHLLPAYIDQLLSTHQLPARLLEIEITESVILTEDLLVSKAIEHLHRRGMKVYIDDFGTGYSSLGHLKKLPIAGIKIDQTFINHLSTNHHDLAIVRSTIELGHRLGMQVIAEGVETKEVWERLATLGCDIAQGFYMGRPMSPADLDQWLENSPWKMTKTRAKRPVNHKIKRR